MTEKIGKVVLDMTYYPGEDYYSDGTIEDKILTIVKEHDKQEYPELIAKEKSWPVFYHLSEFRTNIIDWLPISKTDKVLEIGAGCGALTGSLAEKAGSVTCIDLSKKRSMVNAYRNQDKDNITIMVGNFQDIEPNLPCDYDYVLLIGVFEYGQSYIGGANPYEDFMAICNRHRSKNGRMIIAIENKFGLKYWAGCKEDHLGTYFSGLEGYPNGGSAKTFTRRGLEKIMAKVGIRQYSFYYPYPDYKFMSCIYSDRYLPKKGELTTNLRNFDRDRMLLFDEKQVFDQIIEEKEFSLFSNSYLVVIGKTPELVYSKFSNDRAKPWAIRTSIYENAFGELHVEKIPDSKVARGHLLNTAKAYQLLSKRYEGTKVSMNVCVPKGDRLQFAFCEGETLEQKLDDCLARADVAGFKKLIEEYMKWLSYGEQCNISNIDFIFPNIIIHEDKWQVIDYEWTFERVIPAKEIAFRAFYNYLLGSETRKACEDMLMKDILGFSDEEIASNIEDEKAFQHYINGDRATVADMRELIGYKAYEAKEMEHFFVAASNKYVAQIFYDFGEGFSEDNSIFLKDCYTENRFLKFAINIPQGVKHLRIDPCSYACDVIIQRIATEDKEYNREDIMANGVWVEENNILFDTTDPNIAIECEGKNSLMVEAQVLELTLEAAKSLVPKNPKQRKSQTSKEPKVRLRKGF